MRKLGTGAFGGLVLALLTLVGCGPFWVDPYITVKPSPLNWIEIHYYRMDRNPIRRTNVYVNGLGHVEVKKGTSELISNDFAKRHDSDEWSKVRSQRLMTTPEHANDIFQNLVNHGVLDAEKNFRGNTNNIATIKRFIAVKANLSNYTYSKQENVFETDPDLAQHLLDVIYEFDNPTR